MPIRVLMFGWELPPFNSGGLGVACYGLTQALANQNIEITFVLPKKVGVKADFLRLIFADAEGIPWPNWSAYVNGKPMNGKYNLPPDLMAAVEAYAKRAAAIAAKYPCDIVHAHDWLCFPAGMAASQVNHQPWVSHVHATEFDRSGGSSVNSLVYGWEKTAVDKSDAVIAVSNFTKNLLTKYYQANPDKVNVVHNGVNAEEFASPTSIPELLTPLKANGFKIVLYVGRLTLQKGPDYFLRAAQIVLKYQPKTVFLVVGAGDMEGQIIKEVAGLGLSDHVLFTGFLRGEELKSTFHAADLFVMPSVSEPFGIVALESVAAGTPAIVSKQSGVADAMAHLLRVDFWDVEEMANQILSVLKYPSLHKTLKINGSTEVKKFSWAAAAAKTIAVYKRLLSRQSH